MQKIEAALMKYGEECDLVIVKIKIISFVFLQAIIIPFFVVVAFFTLQSRTERENTEISDILALRGIIN